MKKMLYAGAALMISASIYGFVDYNRTSHKKEFKSLYTEEKKEIRANPDEKTVTVTAKKEISEPEVKVKADKKVNSTVKTEVKKTSGTRKFRLSEFSRGRIPDDEEIVEKEDTKTRVADSITVTPKK